MFHHRVEWRGKWGLASVVSVASRSGWSASDVLCLYSRSIWNLLSTSKDRRVKTVTHVLEQSVYQVPGLCTLGTPLQPQTKPDTLAFWSENGHPDRFAPSSAVCASISVSQLVRVTHPNSQICFEWGICVSPASEMKSFISLAFPVNNCME